LQTGTYVAIHAIERFIADLDLKAEQRYVPQIKAQKEERVAIVGSGPAGLACALSGARRLPRKGSTFLLEKVRVGWSERGDEMK